MYGSLTFDAFGVRTVSLHWLLLVLHLAIQSLFSALLRAFSGTTLSFQGRQEAANQKKKYQ